METLGFDPYHVSVLSSSFDMLEIQHWDSSGKYHISDDKKQWQKHTNTQIKAENTSVMLFISDMGHHQI